MTVLRVQTSRSTRCSAPSPAMAYRSQSLDCHNSPIVLGVCSEMFYLRRTAQRNEVTTGGRSRFHFSIYRMVSQNGFRFPMAQPGGMKSMSIHPPTQPTHNHPPPTPSHQNPNLFPNSTHRGLKKFCLLQKIYLFCK